MNSLFRTTNLSLSRHGNLTGRREFLRRAALGGAALGVPWCDYVSASADALRKSGKACIVLWMRGGPSQFETLSPLPDHRNGGETKAINTRVSGIQLSENLPELAKQVKDICVIRSMTAKEGSHPRATYLCHTGYLPTASIKHPALGSLATQQLADLSNELPAFVRIGGRFANSAGGGYLGVDYDPFLLSDPNERPQNSETNTMEERFRGRLALLEKSDQQFAARGATGEAGDHQKLYRKSARMITSPRMEAFDLEREPTPVREAYGDSKFGAGCLMARRLVEAGVTFVEVELDGWDTHDDNFTRCRSLCGQLDVAYAALLGDLRQRGMLDRTLVLWMGEFGRTPNVNPRAGRDHFPRAFNVALSGAGVVGGQVIGRVDKTGSEVVDTPVTVNDLFRTVATALGIDADRENMSGVGRPMKVVDGGQVIPGCLS